MLWYIMCIFLYLFIVKMHTIGRRVGKIFWKVEELYKISFFPISADTKAGLSGK